jgi:hypothetical protein
MVKSLKSLPLASTSSKYFCENSGTDSGTAFESGTVTSQISCGWDGMGWDSWRLVATSFFLLSDYTCPILKYLQVHI